MSKIKKTAHEMLSEADALGINQQYRIGAKSIMRQMSEGKVDQNDIKHLIDFLESATTDKAHEYAKTLSALKNQVEETRSVSEEATPEEKVLVAEKKTTGKPNPEPDQIPLSKITGGALNPRLLADCDVSDLQDDLSKNELIHPIILRRTSQFDGYEYEVIVGGRRYVALNAVRGENGTLQRHEYRIVTWDDEKCIQAALSENAQRLDLSPYEEGHFLNKIAKHLKLKFDAELEKLTGISRQNVNELRSLADNYTKLPESWKKALRMPPNCQSSDNSITATHYRHIRTLMKGELTEPVNTMLDKAATEHWSCTQLKDAVDALAVNKSSPGTPTIPKGNNKSSGVKKPVLTVQPEGEPEVEPVNNHEAIIEDLNQVINKCKQYPAMAPIAKRIQSIIEDVRKIKIEKAA